MKSEFVGTFEVKSGTMMVSDPCYELGTWCQGKLPNVKLGTWEASISRRDGRVAELCVSAVGSPIGREERATFEVGVDSGQAGFWDLAEFRGGQGEADEKGTFYGDACAATDEYAGIMPGGVVSSSGYGDGGYVCWFSRDQDGQICTARVTFIGEETEDDD
jgi:hypothetical protein